MAIVLAPTVIPRRPVLDPTTIVAGREPVVLDPTVITRRAIVLDPTVIVPWNPLTTPIDFFNLANVRSPGYAELTGATSPRKYEERGGYGLSGATVVFRGVGLCYFTFRIKLYTERDWGDWYAFQPLVNRPPFGTRPKALDIWHPFLEQLGVVKCVIEEVSQPEQAESGEWIITIKFIEFRQPVAALAKPEASQATPADPVEQELIKSLDEFNTELAFALGAP